MDEEIKPVKKRPIGLIVAIAVIALAIMVGLVVFQMKNQVIDYNYTLYLSAKGLNLTCPRMISDGLRLDSVGAKVDKQLWYYYTMTEILKEDINPDCDAYESGIVEALKDESAMQEFGRNGVTVVYHLADKEGEHLCTALIAPEKYYNAGK